MQGMSPEPLRLLIALLMGYPLSMIYSWLFVNGRTKQLSRSQVLPQHLYSIFTGLILAIFLYENDFIHFPIAIVNSWVILRILGPTKIAVSLVFVFAFGYLLIGYYFYSSEDYNIDFTTSFCVLTLRLIGFAMDYYDGNCVLKEDKPSSSANTTWKNVPFKELPNIVETLGFNLFFGGFTVGPQFPFTVYINFVTLKCFAKSEKSSDKDIALPSGSGAALSCFLLGLLYLAVMQIGSSYLDTSFVITSAYAAWPFWKKFLYMTFAGRVVLAKYLGVWTFNEGSCIISGISFDGYSEEGSPKWDGLSNVRPYYYETMTSLANVIVSFNMNTNLWSKTYIFKRLRFLGNKSLSGLLTLVFLAVWHGFSFGYFGAFLLEFLDMESETRLRNWFNPYYGHIYKKAGEKNESLINKVLRYLFNLFFYMLAISTLSVGVVTFDLLTYEKVINFWRNIFFYNHIGIVIILAIDALKSNVKRKNHIKEKSS